MRVKHNSTPEFTPELQIMGDRAEDLGFVWDRVKYPTPVWAIDIDELNYDNPLFNIPTKIWNRELRLWAADCVERTVPVWEGWARRNSNNLVVSILTRSIEIARDYANDTGRQGWQTLTNLHAMNRIAAAPMSAVGNNRRMNTIFSIFHLTESEKEVRSAALAAFFSRRGTLAYQEELSWQRAALAQRIDAIAPWRLK